MCLSKLKALLEVGDLIEIVRTGYKHWGVYAGDGEIIHLTPNTSGCNGFIGIFDRFLSKSVVKCAKLEDVVGNCYASVNNFLDGKVKAKLREEILKCAKECSEKEGYSILFGNCETFANMCRYGNPVSFQAVTLVKILLALDVGIAVGTLTMGFLEDKIGWFGANVAGVIAGAATAGATLYFSMTLAFLEELVITLVTKASKQVLLSVGLGAASNILLYVNIICVIGYIIYILYQVFTSETFKKICSWVQASCSQFVERLDDLVVRTVSRLRSAPQ